MTTLTFGDLIEAGKQVAQALRTRESSIAVSESAAGGLINAALVAVPGASDFYKGGMVVYTTSARDVLAGDDPIPKDVRGATESFALIQAKRAKQLYRADWGIGETGATGPSGNPYGDPPGVGWVACSGETEVTLELRTGNNDRESNMYEFAIAALELTFQAIRA
ncbi:MAG: CinA family protein [Actinomycetota bacterium]|nr:CinA family protein [Actinomycetota bacterium]MEC9473701.1 CinA family protein [Actinomycetota bacterium]MED5361906.1 CinA family protein [Actinomycetota bacterium]MEE3256646.1 CinA family protein [Actinomycetota bacterium]